MQDRRSNRKRPPLAKQAGLAALALCGLACAHGCTHATSRPSDAVMGTLEPLDGDSEAPPSSGRVELFWSVSATSPSYVYVFGEGRSDEDVFELALPGPPPDAALNGGQFGLGYLALLSNAVDLPNGRIADFEAASQSMLGVSLQHAIIFRTPGVAQTLQPWVERFEEGYSCGKVTEPEDGFGEFEPVDCQSLQIMVGDWRSLREPDGT